MLFEGKNLYGQYIDYSEKKKWPKGFICPYTGTIFYIIHIYRSSQVSVYRTIGPLVSSSMAEAITQLSERHELLDKYMASVSFTTVICLVFETSVYAIFINQILCLYSPALEFTLSFHVSVILSFCNSMIP